MFNRKKRAPEHPAVKAPEVAFCDICGNECPPWRHLCRQHSGVVFESKAITDAPEKRGA